VLAIIQFAPGLQEELTDEKKQDVAREVQLILSKVYHVDIINITVKENEYSGEKTDMMILTFEGTENLKNYHSPIQLWDLFSGLNSLPRWTGTLITPKFGGISEKPFKVLVRRRNG
jgi:hypothetical protein